MNTLGDAAYAPVDERFNTVGDMREGSGELTIDSHARYVGETAVDFLDNHFAIVDSELDFGICNIYGIA